jgi:hypothetical protein
LLRPPYVAPSAALAVWHFDAREIAEVTEARPRSVTSVTSQSSNSRR